MTTTTDIPADPRAAVSREAALLADNGTINFRGSVDTLAADICEPLFARWGKFVSKANTDDLMNMVVNRVLEMTVDGQICVHTVAEQNGRTPLPRENRGARIAVATAFANAVIGGSLATVNEEDEQAVHSFDTHKAWAGYRYR